MKNERGIALLITVFILFLLSGVLLHYLSLYESEKRFMNLEKEWNTFDNILLTAVDDLMQLRDEETGNYLTAGKFDYGVGHANYRITIEDLGEHFFVEAVTPAGKIRRARFYYDIDSGEISNWREGRN